MPYNEQIMKTYKIAIIEDDSFISNMYKTKLKLSGYDVRTAYDGEEGIKLIEEFKPDLVLMDLMMPKMSGIAALSKLQEEILAGKFKVIALTNMGDDETINNVKKMGVSDYIVKADVTPMHVAARVKDVLHQS